MKTITWCLFGLLSTSLAVAQDAIHVRVCNAARTPEATLEKAEKEAGFVLGTAGVNVEWLGCSVAVTRQDLGPRDFVLTLAGFSPSPENRRFNKQIMGSAWDVDRGTNESHLTVYYKGVKEFLSRCSCGQEAETGMVLGYAIAHEFGHLFMGKQHTKDGVMRASWGKREVDLMGTHRVRFSADERLRIQSDLAARDRIWSANRTLSVATTQPLAGQKEARRLNLERFVLSRRARLQPGVR